MILDYLYKDEQQEKQRCEEVKHIIAVADSIIAGEIAQPVKEANLIQLEQKYHKTFNRKLDNRHMGIELYRLAEEQMARVPKEESDRMAQIFPWGLLGNRGQDREYYEKFVRLPFENTTMPVPADYHRILSGKYHDYFKIHKSGADMLSVFCKDSVKICRRLRTLNCRNLHLIRQCCAKCRKKG